MKAIIKTEFQVRDKVMATYNSFPVFSARIEETMERSLAFLSKLGGPFSLTLELTEK